MIDYDDDDDDDDATSWRIKEPNRWYYKVETMIY